MGEDSEGVPVWATLVSGDNRVVQVPVWLAREVQDMLVRFLSGAPPSRTPCYAAQNEDTVHTLHRLTELAVTGKDPEE